MFRHLFPSQVEYEELMEELARLRAELFKGTLDLKEDAEWLIEARQIEGIQLFGHHWTLGRTLQFTLRYPKPVRLTTELKNSFRD